MAGMARAMGATLTGAQKMLGKIKILFYFFIFCYFVPHATINCINTARQYLMY